MAAAEEANISLMLLMELRNKALDGYKELMRTPV
jgi:flagellar hook-basal body complex protein FliE